MECKLMINKCLSGEHKELGHLLSSFRNFLHLHSIKQQPDWKSLQAEKLVADLRSALTSSIPRHFAIEENELFPLLAEAGMEQLVEILTEDHELIRSIMREILPVLEKAQKEALLSESEWQTLWRQGGALVTELSAHAEKEDAGMVPELEDTLEAGEAEEIYRRYRNLCV